MESVSKQMSSKILYIVSFFFIRTQGLLVLLLNKHNLCPNLFLLLLETNLTQFTTFYNKRSRRQRDTFFLRTHICFLPPPASHFTSKAGLALRFKPRAKMCSNMSTRPAKIGKREDAFINLPGEWSQCFSGTSQCLFSSKKNCTRK